ncbi:Uncharacterised protein [Dorea longicatena]|nr:Uncharacterised protein [Dorea longicatena]
MHMLHHLLYLALFSAILLYLKFEDPEHHFSFLFPLIFEVLPGLALSYTQPTNRFF